ncbi:MAG: hypothetical protein M0Z77_11250 [Thermoplasmatales archaeon]|nr:hypothetical protein [Candidatus Thermoplasmatota archaeon]MCL6003409.1 hypothetical protein [Candidatus Thermoplasmatota archaeon]MDA8056204.1 hypothetical protein [Thermoplasmatales archaeon]
MSESRLKSILFDTKKNAVAIMIYVVLMLLISPLFPGITWFRLGDFTLDVVNFYHTIMIPLALLVIIVTARVFKLPNVIQKLVNLATYPVLLFSVIGLVLFYPTASSIVLADEVAQGIRDVIVVLAALLLVIGLLIYPFKNRKEAKSIWGAYVVVLIAAVAASIAGIMGMVLEWGNMNNGYSLIPFFQNYVNSIGGTSTFLGNAWTMHSHAIPPAIMGGIVGLTAVIFGYQKLSNGYRQIVNIGMVVATIGVISMLSMYWISTFGTWVIPAVFTNSGGINGLALDDTQTGLVGIGAMIAVIGLVKTLDSSKGGKYTQIAAMGTWVGAMAAMLGIGYLIEFNEVYYGFGDPTQGAGALYDQAFSDGHLLYIFLMLIIAATFFAVLYYYGKEAEKSLRLPAYIGISGIIIGFIGLQIYVMDLSWYVEAIGLWILFLSFAAVIVPVLRQKTPKNLPVT